MLALLLVVSLLPMTALAEGTFDQDGGTIQADEVFDYNEAKRDVTNYGTVTNNTWGSEVSPSPVSIKENYGTVVNNGGYADVHKGTVVNNHAGATVENNNPTGIVENNSGLVTNNTGTVNNNESGGTVEINGGKIQTNNGTVGKKEDGQVVAGSGNNNAIDANCGTVISNNENGTVGTNTAAGKIEINNGTVGIYNDDIKPVSNTGNYGTIGINNKSVTFNQNGATIGINNKSVAFNQNGATIGTNNGTVASNYGTVETNAIDGVVYNEDTFPGIASRSNDNGDAAAPEEKPNVDGVDTNFGTVFDKTEEGTTTTYYGLSWGDSVNSLNEIESFVKEGDERNLDKIASGVTRDGYKMTGYTAFERRGGADSQITGDTTKYLMNAPVWLQILWEQIVTAVEPASSGGEVVSASYNPKYIGLGSVIFINEKGYKVVEIKDDAYVVVSFDALPDEDVQDLDALYAKLFTPEQQKLIKNLGQLLDSEDVLTVFGKPGNHPVYEINKSLVE